MKSKKKSIYETIRKPMPPPKQIHKDNKKYKRQKFKQINDI